MSDKSEEKIRLAKNLQLTKETVDRFESQLKELQASSPTEYTEKGLLKHMTNIMMVNLEMNIEHVRNLYATMLEHELDREIRNTQIQDQFKAMMKQMGIDEDTFRKFKGLGGSSGE